MHTCVYIHVLKELRLSRTPVVQYVYGFSLCMYIELVYYATASAPFMGTCLLLHTCVYIHELKELRLSRTPVVYSTHICAHMHSHIYARMHTSCGVKSLGRAMLARCRYVYINVFIQTHIFSSQIHRYIDTYTHIYARMRTSCGVRVLAMRCWRAVGK